MGSRRRFALSLAGHVAWLLATMAVASALPPSSFGASSTGAMSSSLAAPPSSNGSSPATRGQRSAGAAPRDDSGQAMVRAARRPVRRHPGGVRRRPFLDGSPAIDGDAALLTQVMLNLLKNASEAAVGLDDPATTVSAEPALDGRVKIAVADNGPGIEHSFARRIVMLHGGQIGVAAAGGACLEALLPASLFSDDKADTRN